MRFSDMVTYATNALRQRSIRSWLTVLGIVIGITSIVVLVGLVQGLKDDISKQLEGFGSNTVVILPTNVEQQGVSAGSSWLPTSGKLYLKDYDRVKRVAGIEYITPVIMGRSYVHYKDNEITASIFGVYPELYKETVGTLEIDSGRYLISQDHRTAVLGSDLATDTFDDVIQISSALSISGEDYRVAGILKKTGNSFANLDTTIFVPFDEAKDMFQDVMAENEISAIRITVEDDADPKEIADRINYIMLASHRVTEDKKDFSVVTSDFINAQIDSVTSILTVFLGAIAGISLVVGGVGISNTMFMSVMERRREIGILKAIGATEQDIQQLFLIESSLIGAAGGFFGLLLAYLMSWFISILASINVVISPWVVALAILFSALVGVISGVFPAKEAAKLDPIVVMRS